MKVERRELTVERRESRDEGPRGQALNARRSSFVLRPFVRAFTLIELLTVIAIIGILAALLAPVLKNFSKSDVTAAATRQLLDDVARARQLAISERTTVYMVFIPTNFWTFNAMGNNLTPWSSLPTPIATSTIVTQLYGAQLTGYKMVSLRDVGDQPGRSFPKDLVPVRTLPEGSYIAPFKFTTAPSYASGGTPYYPTNRPDLPIYGFLRTNTIPFPTCDIETNSLFMTKYNLGIVHFVTLPYIAFNYLGQLTAGDGTVLPYDENIPLDYGSVAEFRNMTNKMFAAGPPSVIETPPGNSTNISYNVIHIDRVTGRARLEKQDVL